MKLIFKILVCLLILIAPYCSAGDNGLKNTMEKLNTVAKINPNKAIHSLDSILKYNLNLTNKNKVKLNQIYAFSYFYKSDLKQAKYYFEKALAGSKDLKDSVMTSKLLNNLGVLYRVKGDYDTALNYYESSLIIKLARKDSINIGTTYMNMGNVYNKEGYYITATEYYYKALILFEKLGEKKKIATTLSNIGICQQRREQFYKADSTFKKAYQLFQQLKDENGILAVLNNLGSVQMSLKNTTQAKKIFKTLLHKAASNKDSLTIAFAQTNLGKIAMSSKEWREAQHYFSLAKERFQKSGLINNYTEAKAYYSVTLFMLNQNPSLLNEVDSCFRTAISSKALPMALDIGNIYLTALEKNRDYKKAYGLLKEIRNIQSEIYSKKQLNITSDIETKYKLTVQKRQIGLIKAKKEVLEAKTAIQNYRFNLYITYSIGVLFILSAILFFLLYKHHQKTKFHQLNIKSKNEELTRFALNISENKQFLLSIKQAVKKAKDDREIKEIHTRLTQYLHSNKESIQLQTEIDNFLIKFRRKLEKYPKLTRKDIRLCSLIHIGLSSKDISIIYNITSKGVDMQRYRLRKKINISSDVSIEEWLSRLDNSKT